MSNKSSCIKGSIFVCPCPQCMEEDMQRSREVSQQIGARNNRLQTQVRQFWTGAYTAFDKAHARRLLRAGYDDPGYREGVYLDERHETEKGDDYDF